ncbi:hypothetical protein [Nisaea denitrificans]|uniref:hypothetical protein n=1 Tax=Nisaea denitrificans TaxID=390877 RepID=UPI00048F157C|nr:hypothetical protein [Nisaea denitrificans]
MDTYDLQARHLPTVLAVLPMLLVAVLLVPDASTTFALPATLAGSVGVAIYVFLVRYARMKGREIEAGLFEQWGGQPTTAMLRHQDTRVNQHTKARYHDALRAFGPAFEIPTADEEQANPSAADSLYETAIDEARRRAKITGVKGVRRENIAYGFCRNLLALKPTALSISLISLSSYACATLALADWKFAELSTANNFGFLVLVLITVGWLFMVRSDLVRHHADAYAQALLETLEPMPPSAG